MRRIVHALSTPELAALLLLVVPVLSACSPLQGRGDDDDDSAGDDDDAAGDDDDDAGDDDDAADDDDSAAVADCVGEELEGVWIGVWSGTVYSDYTGTDAPFGDLEFEVVCGERLVISGQMSGAEASGLPFDAELVGEFDDDASELVAVMTGKLVGAVPFSGNFLGTVVSVSPYTLDGEWNGTAPLANGTGAGVWSAELQ